MDQMNARPRRKLVPWSLGVLPVLLVGLSSGVQAYWATDPSWYQNTITQNTPAAPPLPLSSGPVGAVISDGILSLGVQPLGNLGVPLGKHSVNCGVNYTAIQFNPTEDEGQDCDLEGEGWGFAYDGTIWGAAGTGTTMAADTTGVPPVLLAFSANETIATSVVRIGDIVVQQRFVPHWGHPGIYDDKLSLRNVGTTPHHDLLYRRLMSWGAAGYHGYETSSAGDSGDFTKQSIDTLPTGSQAPPEVALTAIAGFESVTTLNPLIPTNPTPRPDRGVYPSGVYNPFILTGTDSYVEGPPTAPGFHDRGGIADLDAIWQFNFGTLQPGAFTNATIYFGAQPTHDLALDALNGIRASIYNLDRPGIDSKISGYEKAANDVTFFIAFGQIPPPPPPVAAFRVAYPTLCTDDVVHFVDAGSRAFVGVLHGQSYDFGDGSLPFPGSSARHTFAAPGKLYSVTYTVQDGNGQTATATKMVAAPSGDCPPLLDPIPDTVVRLGSVLTGPCFHAHDVDDADAQLAWNIAGLPRGANVNAHCLTWEPDPDQLGSWPISVTVCDAHACASQHFWVIIWTPPGPGSPATCPDYDHDGVCDSADSCPGVPNYAQTDSDQDGIGDACQMTGVASLTAPSGHAFGNPPDRDRDGVADSADNCPAISNRDQSDLDGDSFGNVCDPDLDGDGVSNLSDNCVLLPNPDQRDTDRNGAGDACQSIQNSDDAIRIVAAKVAPVLTESATQFWRWCALAVGVVALAAIVAWRRFLVAVIVTFSRLTGKAFTEQPTRAALVARIEAEPGIHYQALVKANGGGRGVIAHHLQVLVKARAIEERLESGFRRYYAAGAAPAIRGETSPTLRSKLAQSIVREVIQSPGRSIRELASAVDEPHQKVSYHVQRLAKAGLLRLEQNGTRALAFPVAATSPRQSFRASQH